MTSPINYTHVRHLIFVTPALFCSVMLIISLQICSIRWTKMINYCHQYQHIFIELILVLMLIFTYPPCAFKHLSHVSTSFFMPRPKNHRHNFAWMVVWTLTCHSKKW